MRPPSISSSEKCESCGRARVCVCMRGPRGEGREEERGRSYKMFLPALYTFAYCVRKKGCAKSDSRCAPSFRCDVLSRICHDCSIFGDRNKKMKFRRNDARDKFIRYCWERIKTNFW